MANMVALEMLVDKAIADEVSEKGLAEIALRRADAKFKAMIKCKILGTPVGGEMLPEKLSSAAMNLSAQNSLGLDTVRNALYSLEKGTGVLTAATKNMAAQVDGIYQRTSSVMNISYLNAGLSLANTAVDVAGFIIVTEKLNVLNTEVQVVANKISKMANVQKNERIGTCQKLIMQCNAMAAKIKDGEDVDLDKLQELLIDLRAFISEMIMDLHDEALGESLVLRMVFTLMPAYTSLFNEFLRRYYFQKKAVPVNYEMFMSLYEELENESFIERLQDYYFLEEKLHGADVLDVLNAQTLIGLNGMVQIEDQLFVLKALGTKEKVLLFENGLSNYAERKLKEAIPVLAEECGMDEKACAGYFFA